MSTRLTIMTASDLHFSTTGRGAGFSISPEEMAERAARLAAEIHPDVFLFGGDLAEQGEGDFERGLEALDAVAVPHKVFIAGNNDVEQPWVASRLGDYRSVLAERLTPHGWNLLDERPLIVGGIALAGSLGWYDGSLWRVPRQHDPRFPHVPARMQAEADQWFTETFSGWQGSSQDFYEACHARLAMQLEELIANPNVRGIVVGTHFVPSAEFVRFRYNTKFDYLNTYMGAQGLGDHVRREKVVMGVTGHTHRSDTVLVDDRPVHNLSGPRQPRVFEIVMEGGTATAREVNIAQKIAEEVSDQETNRYFAAAFAASAAPAATAPEPVKDCSGQVIPASILSARPVDTIDAEVPGFHEELRTAYNNLVALLKNGDPQRPETCAAVREYLDLWLSLNQTGRGGVQRRAVLLASFNVRKISEYQKFFARYGVEVFLVPNLYSAEIEKLWLSTLRPDLSLVSLVYDASNLYRRDNSKPALDEDLERVHNRTDVLVVSLEKSGELKRRLYTSTVEGHIDLSRRPDWNAKVFSWDDIFVMQGTGMTYHDMSLAGHKVSARDRALSQYMHDRFHDRKRSRLKSQSVRAARRTIDFSLSVQDFILSNPLLMNAVARERGVSRFFQRVCEEGVFWRAGMTRLQRNGGWPGLNGGVPFVSKPDMVYEVTGFAHDLGRQLIPDLIYCGEEGPQYRETTIAARMMSEAMTMILADMLFVDTLKRSGVEYDYTKRLIYPLFADLGIDFSDPSTRLAHLKKIMRANVEYALTGRDDRYRQMLADHGSGTESLERFKQGYSKFFVADYRWTNQNMVQMAERADVFKKWWGQVANLRDVAGLRLPTVGEFSRSAARHEGGLIDRVFEEIFSSCIVPALREGAPAVSRATSLKRGFLRYMMGQMVVFADFDQVPFSARARDTLLRRLQDPHTHFDLETIERLRGFYEGYIEDLCTSGWIDPDQVFNFREVYSPFGDPVFVSYREPQTPDLTAVAGDVMGERILRS